MSLATALDSSASLFGGELSCKEIEAFCYRMAANIDILQANVPVHTWRGLEYQLIAPLQVVRVRGGWSKGKKQIYGIILTFQVIDGFACPLKFDRWFPLKFLYVFARELGIGNHRAKQHYAGFPDMLYGMRFIATLMESKYDEKVLTFERYASGQFTGYNKALMKLRAEPCPKKYAWACHSCSLGGDDCPTKDRACRGLTLVTKFCRICNDDVIHDGDECVKCRKRKSSNSIGARGEKINQQKCRDAKRT